MCSSSPDTSGMNEAALQQAALSKEQLDWAKTIYAETAPDREAAKLRANKISDSLMDSMDTQTALAKDYDTYNKTTFRPLEQSIVADANAYNTPARMQENVDKAQADVQSSLSSSQASLTRDLGRSGVNLSGGKALAMKNQNAITGASMLAGAANKARTDTETMGRALKMDAAGLGRNLPANQATAAAGAINAGNSSVNAGQVPLNVNATGQNIMTTGYSGAQAGLAGAASTYGKIAGVQQASGNDGLWGALGSVAGNFAGSGAGSTLLAGWLSDKKAKKNVKSVSGKKSLAAFRKMPVSNWDYKAGKGDGGNHTGPMAQDVRKGLGDSVAPGGKRIDAISLVGHQVNAIKELDRRLSKIEHKAK